MRPTGKEKERKRRDEVKGRRRKLCPDKCLSFMFIPLSS